MSFSRVKNRSQLRLEKRSVFKPLKRNEGIGKKIKNHRKKLFRIVGKDQKNKTTRVNVRTRSGLPIIKQQLTKHGISQARIR